MTFVESIKTCLARKFISGQGRASRSEYWWFFLFNFIANLVLNFIPVIGSIASLVLTIPGIAVAVRRCHDLNKSGWLIILPYVLLIIGTILMITAMVGQSEALFYIAVGGLILGGLGFLILTIFFMFPGTAGPNKYGNAPYVFESAPNAGQQ